MANRHRPHVRWALRRLLVAVGIGLVIAVVIPWVVIPEDGWVVGGMITVVGVFCLLVPLLIAVAMGRKTTLAERSLAGHRLAASEKWVPGLALHVDPQSDPDSLVAVIEADDPKYLDTHVRLVMYALADVRDSSPVNTTSDLARRTFRLESARTEVRLPRNTLAMVPYAAGTFP